MFGVVLACVIMNEGRQPIKDPSDVVKGIAFMAIMSSIFGFFIFLLPGALYAICVSLVSMSRSPRRRIYTVGVSLLGSLVLYPLWLKVGRTGFQEYAWLVGLISAPICVVTALVFGGYSQPANGLGAGDTAFNVDSSSV